MAPADPTRAEPAGPTNRAVEAVWRIESARLIASLARLVRDVGLAEELAQDALVIALEQWPRTGVPDDPGPWLLATAKHRAIDVLRRQERYAAKLALLGGQLTGQQEWTDPGWDDNIDDNIRDDMLRLIFTAAHPVLSTEASLALTLRLLGGLTTAEIARAFLISEPTAAQRIVRAKRKLAEAGARFETPTPADIAQRLPAVLEVIYLIFNEGYAATAGAGWTRPELCQEAMRLGRILAGLLPQEPEAHGLVALMELQASRLNARTDAAGDPVLLPDQDRRRWDQLLIRRGLAALDRADRLGGGLYTLQAAVAACHAQARSAAETDWSRIATLYHLMADLHPTAVVLLNRAVAVGLADEPAHGLKLLDTLAADPALRNYPQLAAARGELLARAGRTTEARAEFTRAAGLTANDAERTLFQRRIEGLA
jgi:RNA polymerase sigma factor (sigma-70 family)